MTKRNQNDIENIWCGEYLFVVTVVMCRLRPCRPCSHPAHHLDLPWPPQKRRLNHGSTHFLPPPAESYIPVRTTYQVLLPRGILRATSQCSLMIHPSAPPNLMASCDDEFKLSGLMRISTHPAVCIALTPPARLPIC